MTKPGLSLSIVVGLVFLLAPPILADFESGFDAYHRGDYATALNTFRPLAEQGEAQAQFKLGVMYHQGLGVTQDNEEAVRWYRQAANQGLASAHYRR